MGLRAVAMTGATSLALFGGVGAAHAAPGDDSNATGTFLGGTLLDGIVDVAGASATNNGLVPVGEATVSAPLDVSVLQTLTVGALVQLPLDFAEVGVVGQYASAAPDGSSVGASGAVGDGGAIGSGPYAPGDLTLGLGPAVDALAGTAVGGLAGEVADLDLTVGAVSARAAQAAPGAPVGTYEIADLDLSFQSPTVSGVVTGADALIAPIQTAVDGLEAEIAADLGTALGGLGGAVALDVEVDASSLTEELDGLLAGTITDPAYPGVAINLTDGTVTVDLAAITSLNGLAPNTEILSGAVIDLIQARVLGLIDALLDDVLEAVTAGVNGVTITGGASLDLPPVPIIGDPPPAPLVTIDTSLGALADGDTSGIALLDIGLPLPLGLDDVVAAITGPAGVVDDLLTDLAPSLDGLLAPVNALLLPAIDGILPAVLSLTANNQATSAEGVFSETALRLTVLPLLLGTSATVELANATVGPNALDTNIDVAITAPADGATFFAPEPGTTTSVDVTGTGQPGSTVTVAIPGQTDQTVPVTADPAGVGVWTATFPGLGIGTYTATATQAADGTTDTVTFSVAEAPDVAITSPTAGQDFSVGAPDDTFDVPVTGTGHVGSTITVVLEDGTEQATTVAADNTWTVTFADLAIGDYTATATQDFDGSSAEVDFSVVEAEDVDITAPDDGAEFVVDGPADLAPEVAVSGTGAPGATVSVSIPGTTLTDVVDVDGAWEVVFTDVPVGEYEALAVQDVDDTEDTVSFAVIAAADVEITAPADGDEVAVPDAGDLATVVFTGTGQEGETVTVSIPGLTAPAAVTVDADDEWSVSFPGVPVGDHTATATQSDGSTDTVDFSVVAAADVAIASPTDDEVFTVASPGGTADVPVSGTGFAGAAVAVTVGTTTQTAIVTPSGTWTTVFEDLPAGEYTATATQDFDGSTDSVDFAVEVVTDVAIVEPADGAQLLVDAPDSVEPVAVSGTGYPGATVVVSIPGQPALTDVVDADGGWSVEFPGLGVGRYTATAVQTLDGSIDTTTFDVRAADDVIITSPEEDDEVLVEGPGDLADVPVSGEGQAGAEIEVSIPGFGTETTTVDDEGDWTVTFDDLPAGDYTATATQDDGSTDAVDFSVAPADDVEITAPTDGEVFSVPGADGTEDVIVSGEGQPTLEVVVTLSTGAELTTVVNPAGEWSVQFEDLPIGEYTATAEQTFDGSTDEVAFEVEEIADVEVTAPAAGEVFLVDGPDDTTPVTVSGTGYDGETVTVSLPGRPAQTVPVVGGLWTTEFTGVPVGTFTATAVQSGDQSTDAVTFEVVERVDVAIVEPDDDDVILVGDEGETATVPVSGTGQPGSTVTVGIPGVGTEETEVDGEGEWSVELTDVPEGEHVITATQDDGSETTVTISVEAADDVVIDAPEPGDVVNVPNVGDTADVVVSGTGEPGLTIEIVLDGGDAETTIVAEDGTWTETLTGVPTGAHTVVATQPFDGSTDEVAFDVEAITDVVITTPEAGDEFLVDDPTDTTDVGVDGTGYTGATVTVSGPGVETQTATVIGGIWSVSLPDLPVGTYTVTATQAIDGVTDTVTDSVTFTVDDRDDVTITEPTEGEVIVVPDEGDTTEVEVCGTGEVGEEIVVTIGGLPPVTVTVDADGEWCVTVDEVPEGEHEVVAEQPEDGSSSTVVIVVEPADDVEITGPADGEQIGVPGEDFTTEVPVTGIGQPGEQITVILDEDDELVTTVGDDGTWTVTFPDVPVGEHEVTAEQEIDGSTSTVQFAVIDVVAPVDITVPAAGAQLTVGAEGDVTDLGVAGTGDPGAEVEVTIEGVDGSETATVAADATWSVVFDDLGVGEYVITATQDVDGTTDTTNVSIAVGAPDTSNARASVTQERIVRGPNATQTVVVSGFQPGELVSGTVNSTPFELLPVAADAFGNARLTFAVGTDFELGQHRVEVRGSVTGELPADREDTAFTVVAPVAGAGSLPVTGGDGSGVLVLGGLGMLLLIAGATLRAVRRRSATAS